MIEAFRNLKRRPLRTGLTIFGIVVGIFALAVMGSLSEYLNTSIDSGIRYAADIVRVFPKGGVAGPGSSATKESSGEGLKKIAHVKSVSGAAISLVDEGGISSNPFTAKYLLGIDGDVAADIFAKIPLESGRLINASDLAAAVIGHNIAAQFGLKVGDSKDVRGTKLTVVGILKPTQNSQIDDFTVVPLKKVQELNGTPGLVNFFTVVPDNPDNASSIAEEINKDFKQFQAISPAEIKKQISQGLLIFNIIILAGAALAVVVGGLATINTMVMSVAERTREIGIKKAVGASQIQIMREFLTESALIGLTGGAIGVGLGKVATLIINAYTQANASGLQIFNLTPRLALAALIFATALGAIAGLIPAIAAARMNIVQALKEE